MTTPSGPMTTVCECGRSIWCSYCVACVEHCLTETGDACEEIDRLRAEVERLKSDAAWLGLNAYILKIEKERDALRAALQDLCDAIPDETVEQDPPLGAWLKIARDALRESGEVK